MKLPLEPHEVVLLSFRRHWFVLFLELLPLVVLLFIPAVLFIYLPQVRIPFGSFDALLNISTDLLIFAGTAWTLILWMKAAGVFTRYYLDAWVVTSDHLIEIEQVDLFHRQTAVLRMDRIQDITVETSGIIATLLHFGNIHVQTAGAEREFDMLGIGNPHYVREVILHQQDLLFHKENSTPDPRITAGIET